MTQQLDCLIAAVKADDTNWYSFPELCEAAFGEDHGTDIVRSAYMGDLNAAKALHERMLPGWNVQRIFGPYPQTTTWRVQIKATVNNGLTVSSISSTPARAWLHSILKAYRSVST